MGEMARALKMMSNLATCIIKNPAGTYSLVGSVPAALTKPYTSGFTQGRNSIIFKTEDEAIQALLDIGIERFQLSNCSWYEK